MDIKIFAVDEVGIGCVTMAATEISLVFIGKAVLLQAWSGQEVSRKLRFPDFLTTAQYGGKVVSLAHWPPLPP
jgi:hypothetical protein